MFIKPSLLWPCFFKASEIRDRNRSGLPASHIPLDLLTSLPLEAVKEESLASKRWSSFNSEISLSTLSRSTDPRTLVILVEQLSHRYSQTSLTSLCSLLRLGPNPFTKPLSVKLIRQRSRSSPAPMKKLTAEGFDLILLMTSAHGLGPRWQRIKVGPAHTLLKYIYNYVGPIVSTARPRSVFQNPSASPLTLLSRFSFDTFRLDVMFKLPSTMVVWSSPQWIRVPLSESSRYISDEQSLLKTLYLSSLNLFRQLKKRLSRFLAFASRLPAYICNLQQIIVAPIQISQARSAQFRTWSSNLLKILECFRQVYEPYCILRTRLLSDLKGPQPATLPIVESLLLQPSSFMERTICCLPSFLEKTVPTWSPVFQLRNRPLILTFLLSFAEEVICLMPVRIEVLDSFSKSNCQSTMTIHHLHDLLVDVVSTYHLLACGNVPYRSCLRDLDLPSKYLFSLSYALINVLNSVVLSLGCDELLFSVIPLIV